MSNQDHTNNEETIDEAKLSWLEFDTDAKLISSSLDLVETLIFQSPLAPITHPSEQSRLNRKLREHGVVVEEFGTAGISTEIVLPGTPVVQNDRSLDSADSAGSADSDAAGGVTREGIVSQFSEGTHRLGRFHLKVGDGDVEPYELSAVYVDSAPKLRFERHIPKSELLKQPIDVTPIAPVADVALAHEPSSEEVTDVVAVEPAAVKTVVKDADLTKVEVAETDIGGTTTPDVTTTEPAVQDLITGDVDSATLPRQTGDAVSEAASDVVAGDLVADTVTDTDEIVSDGPADKALEEFAAPVSAAAPREEVEISAEPKVPLSERVGTIRDRVLEKLEPVSSKISAVTGGMTFIDIIALVVVTVVAALLRMRGLTTFPPGLHGDEAIAGFEMQRVLDEGWIGIYSPSALGQPAIPFYFGAPIIAALDLNVESVRMVAAIGGTLSVVAAFLLVRRYFGLIAGIAAALALALIPVSLHLSRVAFPIAWWPLSLLITIALVARAEMKPSALNWALAGFSAGFGVYIYNAHWMWGAAMAIFIALRLLIGPDRLKVLAAGLGGAISAGPMALHLRSGENSNHFNQVSHTNSPEWQGEPLSVLVGKTFESYKRVWTHLTSAEQVNGVDGAGAYPMVPKIYLLVAAFGAVTAIIATLRTTRNKKNSEEIALEIGATEASNPAHIESVESEEITSETHSDTAELSDNTEVSEPELSDNTEASDLEASDLSANSEVSGAGDVSIGRLERAKRSIIALSLLTMLITPIAGAVTANGEIRRSYLVAVAVAILVGVGVSNLTRIIAKFTRGGSEQLNAVQIAAVSLLCVTALLSARTYFKNTATNPAVQWIFVVELTESDNLVTEAIEERADGRPVWVNWYSGRHHFNYETLQFLRGDRYEGQSNVELGNMPEVIDWTSTAPEGYMSVYVLVGAFGDRVHEIQSQYPQAEIFKKSTDPYVTLVILN